MNALDVALDAMLSQVDYPETSVMFATAHGLMVGYDARWASTAWRCVSVEQEFEVPIFNPATRRRSASFTFAGKVDGIVEHDGRQFLLEHKTASEEIADPNAPYWRRLVIDAQVSGYSLAYWQLGNKLSGTLYDVIRKPGIRPRDLTKALVKSTTETGSYFGYPVDQCDLERLARGEINESPRMFSFRLAADTLENPEKYFQRRPIPRLDSELGEYAQELWDTADEIRRTRTLKRTYRNPNACMAYNSPCEYLPICSGHEAEDSPAYRRRGSRHSELQSITSDGLDVLSNSRMACYRQCRRKHHYRYEVGLERDSPTSEALVFGRLFHFGLEAWWSCFKEQDRADCNGSPTVIAAVGEHGNAAESDESLFRCFSG